MSGRGTAAGIEFQGRIGAVFASLLLAGRACSIIDPQLPGKPTKIKFEVPSAVDDIVVETDQGQILIQAKNSICLSEPGKGDLYSAIKQFVQQYLDGVIEDGVRRDLDVKYDRLVLAVPDKAPDTVKNDLKTLIDRLRTGAATGISQKLQDIRTKFERHINMAWRSIKGSDIPSSDREKIIGLCAVIIVDNAQIGTSKVALGNVVKRWGDEVTVFKLFKDWAVNASAAGTGGDASNVRAYITSLVELDAPPDFKKDVEALLAYSEKTLDRLSVYAKLQSPTGEFSIQRNVASVVVDAAKTGSYLITGEPGSGKSGVLYNAAAELAKSGPVVALTVDPSATTLDALRIDIGLQRPIIDVIAAIPSKRPAYLIIDALDASRRGIAETTYKKLIEKVNSLEGWHVIASVRTFDLQMGFDWRRMFEGLPFNDEHADSEFKSVRHIKIPTLSEAEINEVRTNYPALGTAINASDAKLGALTANPFNLSLLATLLMAGVPETSFYSIKSRQQLLKKYWEVFVTKHGLPASSALKDIADKMVERQTIEIPETIINPAVATTIDTLRSEGLLADNRAKKIAFRHHILFDYAISEILLYPDQTDALKLLKSPDGIGLLIAASIGYWLENMSQDLKPEAFWCFIFELLNDPDIDPIIKIEVARFTVEVVENSTDLTFLGTKLETESCVGRVSPLGQIASAALSKVELRQPVSVLPWIRLVNSAEIQRHDYWPLRLLLDIAIEKLNLNRTDKDIGMASRKLMSIVHANHNLISSLSPSAITFVAKTYCSDMVDSKKLLETLFEESRFSQYGHLEVLWLTQNVVCVAKCDPDFVVEIYRVVFLGADFSRDTKTNMSQSWIFSLTSNAQQDFEMAFHGLNESFKKIIQLDPKTASRCMIATLNSKSKEHNKSSKEGEQFSFKVNGKRFKFQADNSCIWAYQLEKKSNYKDYAKIYTCFQDWVKTAPVDELKGLVELMAGSVEFAIGWRAIFDSVIARPNELGLEVWPYLKNQAFVCCNDTMTSAISAISAVYPQISETERVEAERAWLEADFSKYTDPEEAKHTFLGRLFNAIGEDLLSSVEAKAFLASARNENISLVNRPLYSLTTESSAYTDHDFLLDQGIDVEATKTKHDLNIVDKFDEAIQKFEADKNEDNKSVLWELIKVVKDERDLSNDSSHRILEERICNKIVIALGKLIESELLSKNEQKDAVDLLLQFSYNASPVADDDTERHFSESPSWSSQSIRIQVAETFGDIISVHGVWQQISDRYVEMLLGDTHPAVRYHLLQHLDRLWKVNPTQTWEILRKSLENETNISVIEAGAQVLNSGASINPNEVEELTIMLTRKMNFESRRGDQLIHLISYFALQKGFSASTAIYEDWVANFQAHEHELETILSGFRNKYVMGFETGDAQGLIKRSIALATTNKILAAIRPDLTSWPLGGNPPSAKENAAIKLLIKIGQELYYGVIHSNNLDKALSTHRAKLEFLDLYEPLLLELVTIGDPGTVHHIIGIIEHLVSSVPERCFDLIAAALLRPAGISKYEYESLGASLFIKIVGIYLADYRFVFEDKTRRTKLVQCLSLFVDAGWSEARSLFQHLPELFH